MQTSSPKFGSLVQIQLPPQAMVPNPMNPQQQMLNPQIANYVSQWQQDYESKAEGKKGPAEQFAIGQVGNTLYLGNGEHAMMLRSMPQQAPNVQLNFIA